MFIDPNRNFLWHYPHNGYTYIIDKFQVATGQTYKMEFTQTLINNMVRMKVLSILYHSCCPNTIVGLNQNY